MFFFLVAFILYRVKINRIQQSFKYFISAFTIKLHSHRFVFSRVFDDLTRYILTVDWRKVRAAVMARSGGECQRCGSPASHVDHVIPKHKGGTDELFNLQALCSGCHTAKTAAESARARTA